MAAPLLLYGGTFDPPHAAHGRLPQLAGEAIGASRVVWIPAAQNPLRTEQSAPPEDRVAMLQALLAGNADAEIDRRELQRGGPSYFVDTLRSFRAEDESTPLRFLIGADQALQFRRWHNWEQILDLAHPLIAPRPPHDRVALELVLEQLDEGQSCPGWWRGSVLDLPLDDVSATKLREALAESDQAALRAGIPESVLSVIRARGLYGRSNA